MHIIKSGEYQIVNTHLWAADVMGRIAAFMCGTKVVISTAQNVDIWKKWWHRLVDQILALKTAQVIAVSKAVKRYYHEDVHIPNDKISVIPNAIDVNKYDQAKATDYLYQDLSIKQDDFVLACVGRLNFQKAHHFLFESLRDLKNEMPNLKVLVVGEGELKDDLVQMAKDFDIESMLRFTGQRQDIPEILKFSHALILPSIFEGLPLCVLEAMASARAVIATDVGGTSELAIDQQTAYIVPPKDPQALTAAIRKLYQLPDQGKAMGQAGYDVVLR